MSKNIPDDAVSIYDKVEDRDFADDDGDIMEFENETAAKNYLFGLDFTYEFVKANIEFKPIIK